MRLVFHLKSTALSSSLVDFFGRNLINETTKKMESKALLEPL